MNNIREIKPNGIIYAAEYNKLVDAANKVNGMTGNVIRTPDGIHIPTQKGIGNLSIYYSEVPAVAASGTSKFTVGTVVRVTKAVPPTENVYDLYSEWAAFVVAPKDVSTDQNADGHIGYAVVTEEIDYDNATVGAVAISGQIPVLVKQPSGLSEIPPGNKYAVLDIENGTETESDVLTVYGKNYPSGVAAFRILYEQEEEDLEEGQTLQDPHWALVQVDFGSEIDNDCVSIKSEYTEQIIDGQPVEITGDEDGYLLVDRPSDDSIPAPRILFPIGAVGTASGNPYGFARLGTAPIWVDYTGDEPAIGDDMGTVADEFTFQLGNTGFMCVGVDADNDKALIVANSGGTASITLAQATGSGTDGSIVVKNLQLVDGVPNFEQTGDSYIINYLYSG